MKLFQDRIGIEISDHHVRLAHLSSSLSLKGLHEVVIPHGDIIDDRVINPKRAADLVTELFTSGKIATKSAGATLIIPESRAFSASFRAAEGRVEDQIPDLKKRAQQKIPIPFQKSSVGVYVPKPERGETPMVGLFAIQKEIVQAYEQIVIHNPQITLEFAEPAHMSIYRALLPVLGDPAKAYPETQVDLLVDIGYRWINIVVYNRHGLAIFSRSMAIRPHTDTGTGELIQLDADMLKSITDAVNETMTFLKKRKFTIPKLILAGTEASTEKTLAACQGAILDTDIEQVGALMALPDVEPQMTHKFLAAIGAGMRKKHRQGIESEPNFL